MSSWSIPGTIFVILKELKDIGAGRAVAPPHLTDTLRYGSG
jgi:hypothetical protein